MGINLEQVDVLRERANVSYEEAKEALETCNGDIVEAIIYLENNNKIKKEKGKSKCCSLWEKFLALIRKGNKTKFIIKKKDREIISLPVTVTVIAALIAPEFVGIGLLIALVTGYRIKFQGCLGENMEINNTLDKMSDFVDNTKEKLTKAETANQ